MIRRKFPLGNQYLIGTTSERVRIVKLAKIANLVQMLPAMGISVIELCSKTINHLFIWLITIKSRVWGKSK